MASPPATVQRLKSLLKQLAAKHKRLKAKFTETQEVLHTVTASRDEAVRRENGTKCKHSTCAVWNALSADARRARNRTVAYERKVYAAAVAVHDRRCAERLGKKVCDAVPARSC